MTRLIDANKLAKRFIELEAVALEQVLKYEPSEEHEEWRVWSAILNERTAFKFDLFDAPTIDAVEVVRCKDCRWGTAVEHEFVQGADIRCRQHNCFTNHDSYCSWGERREHEVN